MSCQDLGGTNLSGAKLKRANLCCVVCNDETVFPRGLLDSIVKDGTIEVWEHLGIRVNLILAATRPYLKEEDVGFLIEHCINWMKSRIYT